MAAASRSDTTANRRVALHRRWRLRLAMLGLGFASVPLYRLFCQVTGFGGTTQRASEARGRQRERRGRDRCPIRFDANVARDMPWKFEPEQVDRDGPDRRARHRLSTSRATIPIEPVTGMASFNVEPEQAGAISTRSSASASPSRRCSPAQEVRMPVIYYVDPAILDDADMPRASNRSR